MNKVEIGLKRGLAVVGENLEQDNRRMVSLVNHQLMQLGYMLSEEAFLEMSKTDTLSIVTWSKQAIKYYQSFLGDGNHKTLSDLILEGDLFDTHWSLLSRFWQAQEWEPVYKENYDFEPGELKILNYANEKKFCNIFVSLVRINTALTAKDFQTIEWFVDKYPGNELPMPDMIPFKENLCMLAARGIDVPVKTATDVLRIAAYMSDLGSDLILPPKRIKESGWSKKLIDNPEYKEHKFRKFNRSEKRFLLSLLEKVANVGEIKTREGRWLRLFNMINPQDYKNKYPKAFKAAYLLRNQSTETQLAKSDVKNCYNRNKKIITWKGKLFRAYLVSFLEGLKVQKERAGEFARALDALLRNNKKYTTETLRSFKEVAVKVSNKVLFELYTHFSKRIEEYPRSVFIPGARKPITLSTLPVMDEELVEEIEETIWNVFFEKFKLLEPLGKVWIDERLKNIPLPTNMKTLEDSLEIVIRGTRTPFSKDIKMINAYMYWTAGVDLDLSMTFLQATSKSVTPKTRVCSYSSTNPFPGVRHSGDIIPRMPGAYAEYIGIDIDKTLAEGYRYGLMTVHNYGGGSLDSVGGLTGFQAVDAVKGSKYWLPTNAVASMKLGSDSSTTALILFDFETCEWILVDVDLYQIPHSNGREFTDYILNLSTPPKISVHSLLRMHTDARGSLVEKVEDADTLFKFEDFNTSYEKIVKYML